MKKINIIFYIFVISLLLSCKQSNNHYYINIAQETIIHLCENDLYNVTQLSNKTIEKNDFLKLKKEIKEIEQNYSITKKIIIKEYEIDINDIDVKIIEKAIDVTDQLINVRGIVKIGKDKIIYGNNAYCIIRINENYYQLSKVDYEDLISFIEKSKFNSL